MSMINVTFDTVSKEMKLTMDGEEVPDVCGVDICASWDDPDEYRCCYTQMSKDDENDMRVMTQTMASNNEQGKAVFVKKEIENDAVEKEIHKFVGIGDV